MTSLRSTAAFRRTSASAAEVPSEFSFPPGVPVHSAPVFQVPPNLLTIPPAQVPSPSPNSKHHFRHIPRRASTVVSKLISSTKNKLVLPANGNHSKSTNARRSKSVPQFIPMESEMDSYNPLFAARFSKNPNF